MCDSAWAENVVSGQFRFHDVVLFAHVQSNNTISKADIIEHLVPINYEVVDEACLPWSVSQALRDSGVRRVVDPAFLWSKHVQGLKFDADSIFDSLSSDRSVGLFRIAAGHMTYVWDAADADTAVRNGFIGQACGTYITPDHSDAYMLALAKRNIKGGL